MSLRRRWILFRWRLADWAWDAKWLPEEVQMWLMPGVYYAIKAAHREMVEEGDHWVTEDMMRRAAREYWRLVLEGHDVDRPYVIARITKMCAEESDGDI